MRTPILRFLHYYERFQKSNSEKLVAFRYEEFLKDSDPKVFEGIDKKLFEFKHLKAFALHYLPSEYETKTSMFFERVEYGYAREGSGAFFADAIRKNIFSNATNESLFLSVFGTSGLMDMELIKNYVDNQISSWKSYFKDNPNLYIEAPNGDLMTKHYREVFSEEIFTPEKRRECVEILKRKLLGKEVQELIRKKEYTRGGILREWKREKELEEEMRKQVLKRVDNLDIPPMYREGHANKEDWERLFNAFCLNKWGEG